MGALRFLGLIMLLAATGCAHQREPGGLAMPAPDEARAASLLGSYLLAQGWTVRLAEPAAVEASRAGELIRLEPLLDAAGVDRLIVSRTWPRDPAAGDEELRAFALELNELLNVGQFRAEPGGLVLQTALPFLGNLDPGLLDAFIAFTAEVRLAVTQVQGARQLLAPVEDGQGSR